MGTLTMILLCAWNAYWLVKIIQLFLKPFKMIKYYLYEGGTLIIATTIEKPKRNVQKWVDNLQLSKHRFPVMPDLEAELSKKGYKDWHEVPLQAFSFVAMTKKNAIEMTEC